MTFRKIGFGLLIFIGVLTVLSVASHFYITFQKTAVESELEKAQARESFTPEEIKEDIAYFQSIMESTHPDVIPSFPLGDMQPALTELINTTDQPLTHLAFYQKFAPVINALNDEHTMAFPPENALTGRYEAGGNFFPFDVQFIDSQLYIAQNLSEETKIQPGMEIISINDVPAEELRTTLMAYYSGTRDAQKVFFLQEHFREALYLIYGFGDSFELVMRDSATDTTSSYTVSGKSFTQSELEEFYYEVIAPDTILFTYNAFLDDTNSFTPFLKEMFTVAQEQNIQHLIIDIRANQGGNSAYGDELFDYLTTAPFRQLSTSEVTISQEAKDNFIGYIPSFIRWFPVQYVHPLLKPVWAGKDGETGSITLDYITPSKNELRFNGEVSLLIGPGTMSSASLFAATMQEYGIGTLVGEPSGGYATHYGNLITLYLPNTGMEVWMPTSVNYGNSTGPIMPDHTVAQTVQDLAEQRDVALEFMREMAQSK